MTKHESRLIHVCKIPTSRLIFKGLHDFFFIIKVIGQREPHFLNLKENSIRTNLPLLRRIPGLKHRLGHAICQNHAVLLIPIVVFSSPEISTRSVEVQMQGLGHPLPTHEPSNTWEVRTRRPREIITLRMTSIVTQYRYGLVVTPKREQRHIRINRAFRLRSQRWVARRRVTNRSHFSIGSQKSTI